MEFAYYMHGGVAPLKMGFQVNETLANAGIVVLEPIASGGNAGVAISTTTDLRNAVGVTLDTATYVTAQQTDGTSAEREVDVIISPASVFRALMSGGGTEGTALTLRDVTTATTNGLDITTGDDWSNPTVDEGVAWGYDGANAGQKRKITTVSTLAATLTVAFDNDHQIGDNFLFAPWWFLDPNSTLQPTTNLYQANASIAVGTPSNGLITCIDMELNDIGGEGRTKSYLLFILADHALRETT